MRKQIISLLVAILVFVAMVPAAFAANNQQLAARLEGDSTTSSLVLLDEVCVATDSYGNSYVINPDERTWVSENTVTVFKFYDAGIRDNRHYYEVHMLLFRYYRFSDVPHRGLATHRKEFISYGPCTKGFRQFSFAHT